MADLYRGYSEGLLADEEPTRFDDMYGTAATGLLFAPSAGISDLMGLAPNPAQQGEYLPSFGANIREGNYLDAGLQALGGAGDVMMAGGALFPPAAGVGALMKLPRAASVGLRAYHGSPYDFDRFDVGKIGTGEGAQAYGHGLYFAENKGVAKSYRDTLSRGRGAIKYDSAPVKDPRRVDDELTNFEMALDKVAGEMAYFDQPPKNTIERIIKRHEEDINKYSSIVEKYDDTEVEELLLKSLERDLKAYKSLDPEKFTRGTMYEVNIKADPSDMIDYDLPLSQQPKVLKGIDDAHGDPDIIIAQAGLDPETATGGQLVHALSGFGQGVAGQKAASDWLAKAGVSGIKFFSSNSRNTAGGELIDVVKGDDGFRAKVAVDNRAGGLGGSGRVVTTSQPYKTEQEARDWAEQATKNQERNYVVFDDSMIDILRKYGLLAPLVGAGAVTATGGRSDQQGEGIL